MHFHPHHSTTPPVTEPLFRIFRTSYLHSKMIWCHLSAYSQEVRTTNGDVCYNPGLCTPSELHLFPRHCLNPRTTVACMWRCCTVLSCHKNRNTQEAPHPEWWHSACDRENYYRCSAFGSSGLLRGVWWTTRSNGFCGELHICLSRNTPSTHW